MDMPRISIITPSYNQADYLEQTILSVIEQDYPDVEHIVIDGGSTDGSVEIIRRYARHLAYWESQPDEGQTHAINKGILRASGQVIAFLNSDDVYLPGALSHVAKAMSGEDASQWVVGTCLKIDADGAPLGRFLNRTPHSPLSYLMRLSGMLPQPSSFWSTEIFQNHGHFDRSLHYSFDYEFNCRLLMHGHRPLLLDEPLAAFRMHDMSKGGTQQIRFGMERIEVARRYAAMLSLGDRLQLLRNMAYRQRQYAIQAAQADAGRSLWQTVAKRPWWLMSADVRNALLDTLHPTRSAA